VPTFRIPGPLRRLSNGESTVDVQAGDLRSAIDALDTKYPGFKDRLLDEGGQPRQFVNLYVNDEDIRMAGGLGSAIKESDEIAIVPAVAGGSGALTRGPASPL
jgi:sulfur-carrier protein